MDRAWRARAYCQGMDPDLFFGIDGDRAKGREHCAECDVQLQCLHYAVQAKEEHGTWGGTSANFRKTLRKIYDTGDSLAYQRAIAKHVRVLGVEVVGYEAEEQDKPVWQEETVCKRCGAIIKAGTHPEDRNGPGADCGNPATYNKGSRCKTSIDGKAALVKRNRSRKQETEAKQSGQLGMFDVPRGTEDMMGDQQPNRKENYG